MKKFIKNYLTQLKENEKKGFSLVELIIVMAIMAILVGIVASQVLPYMEKSRQSKDQQQLSGLATDIVSAISQAESSVNDISAVELKSVDSSYSSTSDASDGKWLTQLCQLRSKEGDGSGVTPTTITNDIVGKFKSKKATDTAHNGKKVFIEYKSGVVCVWTGAATYAQAPDKLRVESE